MKLWIKIAIITTIIVLLLVFFFPKSAGVEAEACSCIGYKGMNSESAYYCAGIAYNCVEDCDTEEESDTCTVTFD